MRTKNGSTDMFRCIPTDRVKQFVEAYIEANYVQDVAQEGYKQFSFDSGISERKLFFIRKLERPNLSFDFVDRMLTNLDVLHLWHLPPEQGGFADYYHPDIPPAPAEPTVEQSRLLTLDVARQSGRSRGLSPIDALHEAALQEDAKRSGLEVAA